MSNIGGNKNGAEKQGKTMVSGVDSEGLRSYIARIERLNAEKKILSDDLGQVFKDAKAAGFDVPALKTVIKRRATDADGLAEHEAIVDIYLQAIGDLPLFAAALFLDPLVTQQAGAEAQA